MIAEYWFLASLVIVYDVSTVMKSARHKQLTRLAYDPGGIPERSAYLHRKGGDVLQ